MSEIPEETNEEMETMKQEADLLDACKTFINLTKESHNIKCMVVSIMPENGDPVVAFDGDQIDYTELSVMVASRMRNMILARIGGSPQ